MTQEFFKVTGWATLELYDSEGKLKGGSTGPNLVTTQGKVALAASLLAPSTIVYSRIGIGAGSTAPALGNTALQIPLAVVGAATTVSANTITYSATFGPGVGTGSIAEAGILGTAAGQLLSRITRTPLAKSAGDTLVVTWTITVG